MQRNPSKLPQMLRLNEVAFLVLECVSKLSQVLVIINRSLCANNLCQMLEIDRIILYTVISLSVCYFYHHFFSDEKD